MFGDCVIQIFGQINFYRIFEEFLEDEKKPKLVSAFCQIPEKKEKL